MTVPVSMPKLEMKIDLNVIEHLGLKMYTSLPAVVAEYVANAWDAGPRRSILGFQPTEIRKITQ
jgi:hypothetical protein